MKHKIVGDFIACNLDPEGIIAMDFSSLAEAQEYVKKLEPKPMEWCLHGMCDDDLSQLYHEKDGVVLVNKFEE